MSSRKPKRTIQEIRAAFKAEDDRILAVLLPFMERGETIARMTERARNAGFTADRVRVSRVINAHRLGDNTTAYHQRNLECAPRPKNPKWPRWDRCLGSDCSKKFWSKWEGNRICQECKAK